ncbi:hypothetical protein PAXRUDRAFT_174320 [Paxillus rubicundulus Ve08.2h10]|uniref:Uncharacterized protein n=1 Tax=Paxillus rubicundulus Ve08.2h10 TaxID=930991 RepID=A0A0D0CIE2_9AGAM|nr:hypothetical protein PAXRUDRAFT_174320 [Paxillus rubicundulus Ve08.2h10]
MYHVGVSTYGHWVYLEDQQMVTVEQDISFKRCKGSVLGPPCLQIKGEKRKGSDDDQHANLKDPATTDISNPPPSPTITTKPNATPNKPDAPSLTTIDPLGLNFEAPAPTLRCST